MGDDDAFEPDLALGAAHAWCRVHDCDRQSAIWLDAVRAADRPGASLGAPGHPGGVHHIRHLRDLVAAAGGDRRRPDRAAAHGRVWRPADRWVLGHECLRRLIAAAVSGGCHRRYRRRVHLWSNGRQRVEVVPRSARLGRRPDCCRVRGRLSRDCRADLRHDHQQRLPARVPHLRASPGRGCHPGRPRAHRPAWPGQDPQWGAIARRPACHAPVAAARADPATTHRARSPASRSSG